MNATPGGDRRPDGDEPLPTLVVAAALALGSAVSLGLARFSYALLLPPMRADLGWSYFVAGAMNTVNAAGYLAGALAAPSVLRRFAARAVFLAGIAVTALALLGHGLVVSDAALYALRFVTGLGSAATFISGGLLAARLIALPTPASRTPAAASAGLVLGIYYGGTGVGIVASALVVPALTDRAVAHAWQGAWVGLALLAATALAIAAAATRRLAAGAPVAAAGRSREHFRWRAFAPALAAYLLFGLGYIGYMTFVISLLREERLAGAVVVAFFVMLGSAVVASSWLWAWLLQRSRAGGALALLNALVAIATLLPVVSVRPAAVFASGLLFGAVFLSLVASTTSLVRHNLAPAAWPAGIAAFTIVFAAGQIVGPSAVGVIADHFGGLRAGFACSAAVLALAALVATRQRRIAA
ncbi:MAG TPA: YbfB/YjiJ family MFS transporter [Caldimonas sp.]|nr:YbfB/YjiJ family MFS transporter [Caldimonas sp.]